MEYFIKNFDLIVTLFKPAENNARRFIIIRRRSASELVGVGVLFLIIAGVTLQISLAGYQVLAIACILLAALVAVAIIRDVDALELDDGGNLAVITGPVLFKNSIHIPKSSVQFIGIDIGERYPASGKPHLVYIRHNQQITVLQHFAVGREAVVLAKQVRQFAGV